MNRVAPVLAWLGHSCPSIVRRRGRRRQNGCDDIPVVAGFMGGDGGVATPRMSSHLCSRGLDNLVQACFVGGDADGTLCDAQKGVAPVCGSSAGTPTVRWGVVRSVSVSLTKKRRRYAVGEVSSVGTAPPRRVRRHSCRRRFYGRGRRCCDAKNGVAPVLAWLGQSCPSVFRRR